MKYLVFRFLLIVAVLSLTTLAVPGWVRAEVQPEDASKKYYQIVISNSDMISLMDPTGRTMDIVDNNLYEDNIRDIVFNSSDGRTILTFHDDTNTYNIFVRQKEAHPFDIRVTALEYSGGTAPVPLQAALFTQVDLDPGGVAALKVNFKGELKDMQIMVDQNSDGEADDELRPDTIINSEQLKDKIAPLTFIEVNSNFITLYLTDTVEVSFTSRDTGSGILRTEYSIDGGKTWLYYKEPVEVITKEVSKLYYRSVDYAGNVETPGYYEQFIYYEKPPTLIVSMITIDVLLFVAMVASIVYLAILLRERERAT